MNPQTIPPSVLKMSPLNRQFGTWVVLPEISPFDNVGILTKLEKDGDDTITRVEVTHFASGYPSVVSYSSAVVARPVSPEEVKTYFAARAAAYDGEAVQSGFLAAIAGRRAFNLHSLIAEVGARSDPFGIAWREPKTIGTGIYVMEGVYFDHDGDYPIRCNRGIHFAGMKSNPPLLETTVAMIVNQTFPEGIGSIPGSQGMVRFSGYDVHEVPSRYSSLVEKHLTLNFS